jgi:hypothetical protein
MATKKTRPRKRARTKKAAAKRSAGTGGKKNPTLLRTTFMADFTETFIRKGTKYLWPVTGQQRSDVIADFQMFAEVLSAVGYGLPAPPTNTALGARVVQFIGAPRNWPTVKGVPPRFKSELPTVALVEIAVILDRLLEAINEFEVVDGGPGGTPGGWPPH